MRRVLAASMVMIVLALGGATLIWAPDPGDPPPDPGEPCSPGYWKNHTEVWIPDLCGAQGDCEQLLADLKDKGPGSGAVRAAAASTLDERWMAMYGAPLPCAK